MQNLANMAQQGLFRYEGRNNAGEPTFASGEAHMITASSALPARSSAMPSSAGASASCPTTRRAGAPQNTIIGGASLWVMSGKKPAEVKGVAEFFKYLSEPEVDAQWHMDTGYVPVTVAAYEIAEDSGFYKHNPGTDISVNQMIRKTTDKSRGIRLGDFVQIRTIIDEELEQVWAGKKTPQQGLADITKRGNVVLENFERANSG